MDPKEIDFNLSLELLSSINYLQTSTKSKKEYFKQFINSFKKKELEPFLKFNYSIPNNIKNYICFREEVLAVLKKKPKISPFYRKMKLFESYNLFREVLEDS